MRSGIAGASLEKPAPGTASAEAARTRARTHARTHPRTHARTGAAFWGGARGKKAPGSRDAPRLGSPPDASNHARTLRCLGGGAWGSAAAAPCAPWALGSAEGRGARWALTRAGVREGASATGLAHHDPQPHALPQEPWPALLSASLRAGEGGPGARTPIATMTDEQQRAAADLRRQLHELLPQLRQGVVAEDVKERAKQVRRSDHPIWRSSSARAAPSSRPCGTS